VINITKPKDICVEKAEVELMKSTVSLTQALILVRDQPIPCSNNMVDCGRYSDFDTKWLRVTAYALMAERRCRPGML